jgi:hypothetical protein
VTILTATKMIFGKIMLRQLLLPVLKHFLRFYRPQYRKVCLFWPYNYVPIYTNTFKDPSCLPISLGPPKGISGPNLCFNQFMAEVMFPDIIAGEEQCHEPSYTMEVDTPSEEPNYQWKISSMTSSIENMNHHIMSLEEEVSRLNNVTDPILRKVLMSAVAATIKNNTDTFRSSRTRCFQSLLTRFRFGTIISQTQSEKRSITIDGEISTQYETTTTFIFYPASWLIKIGFKYGIEATTTNSKTGWKYSISPVQAVQNDSLIFRFCESGNVDAVRELFKNKEASVVDVNSTGWRPLHVSNIIYIIILIHV